MRNGFKSIHAVLNTLGSILVVLSWILLIPLVVAAGWSADIGELLSKLVYWATLLIFLATACQIIGLEEVASVISDIFSYIPNIAATLIIVILGSYIARILHDTVETLFESANIPCSKYASDTAQVVAYISVAIIALEQLGLDTQIIISNLNIIIAGFALAFGLAVGLGGKAVVQNIITMRYLRKIIHKNHVIEFKGNRGKILKTTSTNVVLEDSTATAISCPVRSLWEVSN